MHRKPFHLSSAHALKPLMVQTFAVQRGTPDTMRALLAQLDRIRPVGHSLGERLGAIKTLSDAETNDVQAASRAKN